MLRRREEVEPFISGVFDAYVSNMALEGIWGGVLLRHLHCCDVQLAFIHWPAAGTCMFCLAAMHSVSKRLLG